MDEPWHAKLFFDVAPRFNAHGSAGEGCTQPRAVCFGEVPRDTPLAASSETQLSLQEALAAGPQVAFGLEYVNIFTRKALHGKTTGVGATQDVLPWRIEGRAGVAQRRDRSRRR